MAQSNEYLEIALSKKKMTLMLFGSFAFVVIGIWFTTKPFDTDNSFLIVLIGIMAIVTFGLTACLLIIKLRDTRPGLIIGHLALTDNSSAVTAGEILWDDITNVVVMEIYRQKLIGLIVKDPQAYIDRQTSSFKKRTMKFNYKMYGTPIWLSANTLKISFDELLPVILAHVKEENSLI